MDQTAKHRTWIPVAILAGISLLALCMLCAAVAGFAAVRLLSEPQKVLAPEASPSPATAASPLAPGRTPTPPATKAPLRDQGQEQVGEVPGLPEDDWTALADGLLPELRPLLASDRPRPFVRMAVRLDPEERMLTGEEAVSVPVVDAPLHQVCFRMFANAHPFGETRMEVGRVWVDVGSGPALPVHSAISNDETSLVIALDPPVPPGGTVEVGLIFTLTLGMDDGGYGLTRALPDGRIVAYYFYPEPARIRDGWCVLDPPWENGDLHQAEATHFRIRLDVPGDTEFAVGGVVRGRKETDGRVIADIVAPFARNVVLVAWPEGMADAVSVEAQQEEGSVRVNGFRFGADRFPFAQGMESAAGSLELFSRSFGPYPFPELDVVEVPLQGGAAGMEASGLILIGEEVYEMGDLAAPFGEDLDLLGFVVAHEVAHQWWYGMVGSDAHTEPWLDEGLTNWSAAFWVEHAHGRRAADDVWDLLILLPYRLRLLAGDLPLDLPAERYSEMDYAAVVYGKGAWMVEMLRRELGEERFLAFLRRYLERHRFGWATGDSWKATLAEVWGAQAADAFYRKWVSGAGAAEADLPEGGMFGEMLRDPALGELLRTLLEALAEIQP